jgi:prepilin-type N-terminal cleavage/methylation domain-containing protein
MFKNKGLKGGFTLIEILVVIGIIALLATIVLIAINPARQFAQARNTQRISHLNTILNAIGQNIADNKGMWKCGNVYFNDSTASTSIGTSGSDLTCLTPTYIGSGIPVDPTNGTPSNTQYYISTTTAGRFMLCAPNALEPAISNSAPICITR